MIVVTGIEICHCERDSYEVHRLTEEPTSINMSNDVFRCPDIETEIIRGRLFVNARGEEVCLGASEDIQKALGIPMEAFDNLRKEVEKATLKVFYLEEVKDEYRFELLALRKKYKTMSFLNRLKFLLFGYKED